LKFLAGLEADGLPGRDADFLAGARIAADSGFARTHVKNPKAAQLDSLAFAESVLHGFKNGFDGLFRLRPAYTSLIYYGIYNV
jgi:hypothetical protein